MCTLLVYKYTGSKKNKKTDKNTKPIKTTPTETSITPKNQPTPKTPPEEKTTRTSTSDDPMLKQITPMSKLDYAALRKDTYLKKLRKTFIAKPNTSHQDLLRFTIPTKLYIDSMKPEFINSITDQSYKKLFINKYNICNPIHNDFSTYNKNGMTPINTKLSNKLDKTFTGKNYKTRNKSLTYLIHHYTKIS